MSSGEFFMKGFSPLTTPDIARARKKQKKHKSKRKERSETDEQQGDCCNTDTESQVDRDIIRFADKVSIRLKNPHSDKESEVEFSPKKVIRGHSAVKCNLEQTVLAGNESKNISKTIMGRKFSEKVKRVSHEISESESESNSDSLTREVTSSPSKESVNVTRKTKKKSPSKYSQQSVDKNFDHSDDSSESSDSSDDSHPTDSRLQVELRYKPDDDFVMKTEIDSRTDLCTEDIEGKDLWLIKAPVDFDMKSLNGQNILLNGLQPLHTDSKNDYEVHAFEDDSLSTSTLQPMLPCRTRKTYLAAPKFKGQMHIMQTIEVPPLPKIIVPKPVKHKIPAGLKLRYEPFGSVSPSLQTSETAHRRKRKHQSDNEEETDVTSQKKKKKKKKHKHHRN